MQLSVVIADMQPALSAHATLFWGQHNLGVWSEELENQSQGICAQQAFPLGMLNVILAIDTQ